MRRFWAKFPKEVFRVPTLSLETSYYKFENFL